MAKKLLHATGSENNPRTLFGISCHLKDFRLSFLLNKQLGLDLVKIDDFRDLSCYSCRDEDHFTTYFLLANRSPETVLIPELRQTDFLLLVEGPFNAKQKEWLLENTRKIQNVLTAFEIHFETIKNHTAVLNDLELHIININRESKLQFTPSKK